MCSQSFSAEIEMPLSSIALPSTSTGLWYIQRIKPPACLLMVPHFVAFAQSTEHRQE